jgi:ABC-type protease/lipase transport system fused ATPase/permease subunit
VILDEPTAGLDATGIDDVRNAVEHLKEIGKIVMVASHSLAALRACDRLLWIEGGQARMFGQQQAVLQRLLGDRAQASLRPLVRRSA